MEKQLKAEIVKASDSIRKKFRLLKKDEREELETNKKILAPLVSPLKTLVDLTKETSKKETEVKVEPKIKVEPRVVISKTPRKKKEEIEDDSLEESLDTSDEEIYETPEPLTEDHYKQKMCLPKNTNQSTVHEYINRLLQDSESLCHESFFDAITQRVNQLVVNSTSICAGIPEKESHTACGILLVLTFVFSTICLVMNIFRFVKSKNKNKERWKNVEILGACGWGVDVIELVC